MSEFQKFVEFYKDNIVPVMESPMRTNRYFGSDMDSGLFNFEQAKDLVKTLPLILSFESISSVKLYRDDYDANKFQDFWITDRPFVTCYFIFEKHKTGLQSLGVWNDRQYNGTARDLFFNYYLKNFDYIISDNQHSDKGEVYWKKIIDYGTQHGYKVVVVDRKSNEHSIEDKDAYWGNPTEFANYRIKIYKK
jgi:hypothetical protein